MCTYVCVFRPGAHREQHRVTWRSFGGGAKTGPSLEDPDFWRKVRYVLDMICVQYNMMVLYCIVLYPVRVKATRFRCVVVVVAVRALCLLCVP